MDFRYVGKAFMSCRPICGHCEPWPIGRAQISLVFPNDNGMEIPTCENKPKGRFSRRCCFMNLDHFWVYGVAPWLLTKNCKCPMREPRTTTRQSVGHIDRVPLASNVLEGCDIGL